MIIAFGKSFDAEPFTFESKWLILKYNFGKSFNQLIMNVVKWGYSDVGDNNFGAKLWMLAICHQHPKIVNKSFDLYYNW